MILPDDKSRLQELIKKTRHLWKFLDCDEKKKAILELEELCPPPHFGMTKPRQSESVQKPIDLSRQLRKLNRFESRSTILDALAELCDEDENDQEMESEFISTFEALLGKVEDLEVASFLGEPFDDRPALLSIHAGAGGTESCDWADMLMRMYMRWAERRGFKVELQDLQPGEEAGVSRCSFEWKVYMPTDTQRRSGEFIDWFELVLLTPIKEGTPPFVPLM